jgi:hypothetical protein
MQKAIIAALAAAACEVQRAQASPPNARAQLQAAGEDCGACNPPNAVVKNVNLPDCGAGTDGPAPQQVMRLDYSQCPKVPDDQPGDCCYDGKCHRVPMTPAPVN